VTLQRDIGNLATRCG